MLEKTRPKLLGRVFVFYTISKLSSDMGRPITDSDCHSGSYMGPHLPENGVLAHNLNQLPCLQVDSHWK